LAMACAAVTEAADRKIFGRDASLGLSLITKT
jgi:hypothetical protein